jgi:acyl-homoserine-lactone acylase
VPVTVVDDQGRTTAATRQVYLTHYGPILESENLPWTHEKAYAVRDANIDNDRAAETYDVLNKARSIADVEAALEMQGVAWTNTIAADRHGAAFYADISVTPNVDGDLLDRCRVEAAGIPGNVVILDGANPDCEWRSDDRSAIPGVLPPAEMPRLERDDYVANSNDSYWLSNPAAPLEGFSPIIGNERTARSLRTRAGLQFIREAMANGKIGPEDVQNMLYSHRNYGAELLLDDLMALCAGDAMTVQVDDNEVDVSASCQALAGWDRRMAVDSRGGHVWREFWRNANRIEGLYRVPFDVTDPVDTPRGLRTDDPAVRSGLLEALARAQMVLAEAGIAPDARLGDIQFAERNGERIPIPGGEGWAGMWSMIVTDLEPGVGYSPIRHGNSYIQVISWDEAGRLDPRAIVTYSQSPEPESPHYADMTRLYSKGEWVKLPFTDAEIEADPNLVTLVLAE